MGRSVSAAAFFGGQAACAVSHGVDTGDVIHLRPAQ